MANTSNLTENEKHEWAKLLYTSLNFSAKETALKTGIDEPTIQQWITTGYWEKIRRSLFTSKETQTEHLYDILAALIEKIKKTEDLGDSKDADKIIKYTAAIKNLETETNIGEMIDTGKRFIRFLMKEDIDKAREITGLFNAFVQDQFKNI